MSELIAKNSDEDPGNAHYYEKLLSHFSRFADTVEDQPSHFENEFDNFEKAYFDSLAPTMHVLMNMTFPQAVRMAKAIWLIESK